MRDVLIIFMILLALLLVISALGGSMRFGTPGGGGYAPVAAGRWNGAEYFTDGAAAAKHKKKIDHDGKVAPPHTDDALASDAAKFTQAGDIAEEDDEASKKHKSDAALEGFEQGSKTYASFQ
jgi:hypothetical protein